MVRSACAVVHLWSGHPRLRIIAICWVLLATAACPWEPAGTRGTISAERFIAVNVDLRRIDPAAEDAAEQRSRVLAEHGITGAELRAFVEARAERPQELARIWTQIQERLEQLQQPEPGAPGEGEGTDTVPGSGARV